MDYPRDWSRDEAFTLNKRSYLSEMLSVMSPIMLTGLTVGGMFYFCTKGIGNIAIKQMNYVSWQRMILSEKDKRPLKIPCFSLSLSTADGKGRFVIRRCR